MAQHLQEPMVHLQVVYIRAAGRVVPMLFIRVALAQMR
jgi:hypothetical protein